MGAPVTAGSSADALSSLGAHVEAREPGNPVSPPPREGRLASEGVLNRAAEFFETPGAKARRGGPGPPRRGSLGIGQL